MTKQKITLKSALSYLKIHQGNAPNLEWHVRRNLNGKEILVVAVSYEPLPMPGIPYPERTYRVETFVNGKHRAGMIA